MTDALSDEQIAELERLNASRTPGRWWWATGCSWRRLLSQHEFDDVPVIMPTNHRIDGHVDCDVSQRDQEWMDALFANATALIAAAKREGEMRACLAETVKKRDDWKAVYKQADASRDEALDRLADAMSRAEAAEARLAEVEKERDNLLAGDTHIAALVREHVRTKASLTALRKEALEVMGPFADGHPLPANAFRLAREFRDKHGGE